jgi:SAM-dependent methyltransferase
MNVVDQLYRDDLAHIHDTGFGALAENAAPVLIDALQRNRHQHGLVVDLGCGSGILSAEVAAHGYNVLGVDLSASMLALARQRVPEGEFCQSSFLQADLPTCIAVTGVGEVFNYLFDEGNTKRELRKLLRRIHSALCSRGILLFDLAEPGRVPGGGPLHRYVEGKDWVVCVTTEEDQRGVLTRRITTFRQVGTLYRRDEEIHRQRLYPRAEITALLRELGFRVRVLSAYGLLRFPQGLAGFLARKE